MSSGLFDLLPISAVYLIIVLLIIVSFEVGFQFSKYTQRDNNNIVPDSINTLVGGILALLAFVLAFTFSMAASQYELKKRNVLDEANEIGTAYLRADLVDEQSKVTIKGLLEEYVNVRLQAVTSDNLAREIARSEELHVLMWTQVASTAQSSPNINTSLLIQSINGVIDMHQKRLTGAIGNRIPFSIWLTLLAISALTMATIGIQAGYTKARRLGSVIPMALAFAAITTVIVDLDRPQNGVIKVGQESMISLQKSMNQELK